MQLGISDNISIASSSVEYYYPDDESSLYLSIKDEGSGPFIKAKIEGEISFDSMDELIAILNDFSTRFPLSSTPPRSDRT